jgi:hypothetical protein
MSAVQSRTRDGAQPSRAQPSRYLRIYLQDHYAGATGGTRLAERAARDHPSGELGSFLRALADEISEDRSVLAAVMRTLGVAPSSVKNATVAAAELLGRLKPNGHFAGSSPLTPVVELEALTSGVSGKRALWQALAQQSDSRLKEFDFGALVERADRQLAALEENRLVASRAAFGGERAART